MEISESRPHPKDLTKLIYSTVCEEHQTFFFSKCNDRLRMRMEHMC